MQEKINIAIVDDHQIVIDGITSLLEGRHNIHIAATSNSGIEMLQILKEIKIDILLTDIMMPAMNGQELAQQVKAQFPAIKILALSMSGQGFTVNKMIEDAEIAGYILKNIGKQELIHAIEKIANGGIYFSEEVLNELQHFSTMQKENEDVKLTSREIDIIKLIEKECSNKDIASQLFISERTVETHRKNIFRKTGTGGVVGLIKYAYEHKII
ncbi:MAG: response regulator transcription factor [Chitinophagaceae bacterium]|nr:response regulator transcription factor [Chitinophagaceae bacterium]